MKRREAKSSACYSSWCKHLRLIYAQDMSICKKWQCDRNKEMRDQWQIYWPLLRIQMSLVLTFRQIKRCHAGWQSRRLFARGKSNAADDSRQVAKISKGQGKTKSSSVSRGPRLSKIFHSFWRWQGPINRRDQRSTERWFVARIRSQSNKSLEFLPDEKDSHKIRCVQTHGQDLKSWWGIEEDENR